MYVSYYKLVHNNLFSEVHNKMICVCLLLVWN